MKIAEINTFPTFSIGNIIQEIMKAVEKESENQIRFFYARGNKINRDNFIYIGNRLKILSNALFARLFDNDGFCIFSTTNTLIAKLKDFDPDIIHIHSLHGYYANSKILFEYFQKSRAKIVWTIHDLWPITGHCCYFELQKCDKRKTKCYNCPQKLQYPKSILLDNSNKNFKIKKACFTKLYPEKLTLVAPSNYVKEVLEKSFLSKYKIEIIKNGINPDDFYITNTEKRQRVLLGVASVWDKRKNIDAFINVANILKDKWKIILVGKISNKVNIPNYITYYERTTSKKELLQLYNQASVFFNPTLEDTFGMVNLEAQACGCKVLCNKVCGTPETQIGNLYLFTDFSPENLAMEINNIFEQKLNNIDYKNMTSLDMANEYKSLFKTLLTK